MVVPVEELFSEIDAGRVERTVPASLRSYAETLDDARRGLLETYRYVHLARKVVGVGSVGRRAWIALFVGRDEADALILQVKQAERSVVQGPSSDAGPYANRGQRVVEGQRRMQAASDIFLGWGRSAGEDGVDRDFYVRQLWDWKASADLGAISPSVVVGVYDQICGWTLARPHARSGDRFAIASYLGPTDGFDTALSSFARSYADQNEHDHAALLHAIRSGRTPAAEGDTAKSPDGICWAHPTWGMPRPRWWPTIVDAARHRASPSRGEGTWQP